MSSDALRRSARALVYPAAEAAWVGALRVLGGASPRSAGRGSAGVGGASPGSAGRGSASLESASRRTAGRSRPRRWESDGGRRVVIVAPHPDDETIGAGGVAALHVLAGDAVSIVVVTDGGGSRAFGLPPAEMARRRQLELSRAAHVLGVTDLVCCGFPEWTWRMKDLREALRIPLRHADVVYAPSCVDYNPEHVRVARVTSDLLRAGQVVRICELGVPLTPLLVNLIADIGTVRDRKARALAEFGTQSASLAGPRRLARYRASFYGLGAAEVFWELDAADYARVLESGDWRRGLSPFIGMSANPLRDPLCLAGLRVRYELRRVAERGRPARRQGPVGSASRGGADEPPTAGTSASAEAIGRRA